jgi:hypothetical protein
MPPLSKLPHPTIVATRECATEMARVYGDLHHVRWVSPATNIRSVLAATEAVALVLPSTTLLSETQVLRSMLRQTVPGFTVIRVGDLRQTANIAELSIAARTRQLSETCAAGLTPLGTLLVRGAFSFILASENRSVQAFAGGVCVRSLERWMVAEIGMSPATLLRWTRVLVGLTYCEFTFTSLDRIAEKIGYANAAGYVRACRGLLGLPPRAFVMANQSSHTPEERRCGSGGGGGG